MERRLNPEFDYGEQREGKVASGSPRPKFQCQVDKIQCSVIDLTFIPLVLTKKIIEEKMVTTEIDKGRGISRTMKNID